MTDWRDLRVILLSGLFVVALFSVRRVKGFPALEKGHVYQVTAELEPGTTDEALKATMADLEKAYGETWKGWQKSDPTHVQWTFLADKDQPAPTGLPKWWVEHTVVDDLGPRVIL
jgi:hypothetical protein